MNGLVGFFIEFKRRVPIDVMEGCRDRYECHPHEYRQCLVIYATRAEARRAARLLDKTFGKYWTTRIRKARRANTTEAQP